MGPGSRYCLLPSSLAWTGKPDNFSWNTHKQAEGQRRQHDNAETKVHWQRWMDGGKTKEELFPGLVSELFWTLNSCVQMFAWGSAGLAPELPAGRTLALESPPRLWALASACPGCACCHWPPGPFHRSPTLLPASMSQTNSLTAWWGWQEPLCFSPPQCSILMLNITY